ncbi:Deoxyguanosinetriphosphate triphosphohydrolase-like protein [Candidatus Magnetomoraceae bacterium gMMP-15]
MSIREEFQKREKSFISPFGCLSSETKGRQREIEPCLIRTPFQRDRDRIVYCNAFRRLKHKTQVFLSPLGDHYRTRLTHTLEVSEIARTIARAMRLNEDLTEAIALGHDLGHTPFGHGGEASLKEIFSKNFSHDKQSLRVVDVLENQGKGLNLTYEVRDGILKHSKGYGKIIPEHPEEAACTIEGQIVRIADIMGYINHDLDDAIRSKVISADQIPKSCLKVLGRTHSERVSTMIKDAVFSTRVYSDKISIRLSDEVFSAIQNLREFLYNNVYRAPQVHNEFVKAKKIITELYTYLLNNKEAFRKAVREMEMHLHPEESVPDERSVADVVASMTDRYALGLYKTIFFPSPLV